MDWFSQVSYLGAFLVGLAGAVHCIGMCGGIVAALTPMPSTKIGAKDSQRFIILLAYNLGRLASYTLAGALIGGLGAGVFSLVDLNYTRQIMLVIASLFMLALGLYLAGIWQGIAYLERGGKYLWKYIEPVSRRFIPADTVAKAIPLGFLWGWLPCGLVYTILVWSLSAGSVEKGALLMLAFGLGTLPNLLAMGYLATRLSVFMRSPIVKKLAGLFLGLLGLWMLFNGLTVQSQNLS